MKIIERAWKTYLPHVTPPGVNLSYAQVEVMRHAFFSGAGIMFTLLVNGVSDGPDVADSDLEMMSKIADEIESFSKGE